MKGKCKYCGIKLPVPSWTVCNECSTQKMYDVRRKYKKVTSKKYNSIKKICRTKKIT